MSALRFLQFLGVQHSCSAASKIPWLQIYHWSTHWSWTCCCSLLGAEAAKPSFLQILPVVLDRSATPSWKEQLTTPSRDLPITSFSHIHLSLALTSSPCQPYTHSLLETSSIHVMITHTQLRLTREKCPRGRCWCGNAQAGRQHTPSQWQSTSHKPCFPYRPSGHLLLPHHACLAQVARLHS